MGRPFTLGLLLLLAQGLSISQQPGLNALEPSAENKESITPVVEIPTLDCEYGKWEAWSVCSATCGIGTKWRIRTVVTYPTEQGKLCTETRQAVQCETGVPCVPTCEYHYGPFSPCSKTCGGGVKTAQVVVDHFGRGCPSQPLVLQCNKEPCQPACQTDWTETAPGWQCTCDDNMRSYWRIGPSCEPEFTQMSCAPIDDCPASSCQFEDWRPWGTCSALCGKGSRFRSRGFKSDGKCIPPSPESLIQQEECDNKCKKNCVLGPWDETLWKCNKPCGTGSKGRRAQILEPASNGGSCSCSEEGMKIVEGFCEQQVFCNEEKCPVDCEVGEWTDFSPCTKSCMKRGDSAMGTQLRRRTILRQPQHNGKVCPSLEEKQECGAERCPEDCVVGGWGPWSVCSADCGGGQRERTRFIEIPASNGGKPCATTIEFEACNTQICPVDCSVSEWSEWTQCTRSCQSAEGVIGTRRRRRTVMPDKDNSALACPGAVEYQTCNPSYCPVDCQVSEWKAWSTCSAKCDGGFKYRERDVVEPFRNGGQTCPHLVEKVRCNTEPCSRDCVVGVWGPWGNCSEQCGGGTREASREILITPVGPDAKSCPNLKREGKCNVQPCPQNCEMSDWSEWSPCNAKCGSGSRFRTRTIVTHPVNGGVECGAVRQQSKCEGVACLDVNCLLTAWGPWSQCSQKCIGVTEEVGKQSRTRSVIEQDGVLSQCKSPLEQTRFCNEFKCPVHSEVSPWSDWSPCSANCGGGKSTRSRAIVQVPRHHGKPVPHLYETKICNTQACPKDCSVSEWSVWSPCSLPCKVGDATTGVSQRVRNILTNPDQGGKACPDLKEVKTCNEQYCPQDCVVSSWGPESACSSKCGYGYTKKERNVLIKPLYRGRLCPPLEENMLCNLGPCNNCSLSAWSEWSECSKKCGGGFQVRNRQINRMTDLCPTLHEEQACNQHECPEDCMMSPWGTWGQCNDDGIRTRQRYVIQAAQGRGKPCPLCLQERDDCIPPFKPEECWLQPCSEDELKAKENQ